MTWIQRMLYGTLIATCLSGGMIAAQAPFDMIGSNEREAQEQIFSAFSGGVVSTFGVTSRLKSATAEERAVFLRAALTFARAYTGTADFARRYAMFRDSQKPAIPKVQSGSQVRDAQREGIEQGIKNMEEAIKKNPSMKSTFEPLLESFRQQLKDLGQDKQLNANMDKAMAMSAAGAEATYKKELAAWEAKYPVDPKPMIAARLKEFLALSATVDFSAKTQPKEGKQVFVNPVYERKDKMWKLLYRAGQPMVELARAFAQEWVKAS